MDSHAFSACCISSSHATTWLYKMYKMVMHSRAEVCPELHAPQQTQTNMHTPFTVWQRVLFTCSRCIHILCECVCVFYESVFTLWLLLMPFRLPAAHEGIIMGQRWLRLALWQTHTHIYTDTVAQAHTHALFLPHTHTHRSAVCLQKPPRWQGCAPCPKYTSLSLADTNTHTQRSIINQVTVCCEGT